jgi:transcriptional regulator with XRE-family HTH domain
VITIRNSQHLARVLRHLREQAGLTRRELAGRLYVSATTIANRERGCGGWHTDSTIDAAHTLGYDVALTPSRRPGRRNTGTGWPT